VSASFLAVEFGCHTTEEHTEWTVSIDNAVASELRVWTATGEIDRIGTNTGYDRRGYATAVYEHAKTERPGGIFHSIYTGGCRLADQ
jgi:hypothetical protein